MNLAYWEEKYYFKDNDLIVVGAGIVGLSTAISFKKIRPDLKVLVVERSPLPTGASTKNAGFACFGSVTELIADHKVMTDDELITLIRMRWNGLQLLQSNVSKSEMRYRERGGTELFDENAENTELIYSSIDYYNTIVSEAIGLDNCYSLVGQKEMKGLASTTIFNQYEGDIQPMHMMAALQAKAMRLKVNILYGVNVLAVDSRQVTIENRSISAKNIAVCTNGFTKALLPNLDLYAVRNQVFVTSIIENNPLKSCYHYDQGFIYFREINGRILIGGARNLFSEQETTEEFGQTENLKSYLASFVEEKILGSKVSFEYEWSGILGVGDRKTPIIHELKSGLFIGVRLGGMGVAMGSGVGKELAELIVRQY